MPNERNALTRLPALSRRALLGAAGLIAGSAAAAPVICRADAKVSQREASYQTSPRGEARCAVCTQFQPPTSCKLVAGAISATGWCAFFAPRPR